MGKFTKTRRLISALMPEALVAKLNPHRPIYRGVMIDAKAFAVGRLITVMRPRGEMPNDFVLPTEVLDYFLRSYLGNTDRSDPMASPIFGSGFESLPETYILNGGFDPLADDGKAYADKLKAAGVAVTHKLYSGQIHGFISLTKVIPQGVQALEGIAEWLKFRA